MSTFGRVKEENKPSMSSKLLENRALVKLLQLDAVRFWTLQFVFSNVCTDLL